MKVKIIEEDHEKNLEEAVNYWLENNDYKIIDIKFSTLYTPDLECHYHYYAMIIYK